jgi:hypothetical protein
VSSKFRYILFPDNIYKVVLDEGNDAIAIEMSGKSILDAIKKQLLLDMPSEYEV